MVMMIVTITMIKTSILMVAYLIMPDPAILTRKWGSLSSKPIIENPRAQLSSVQIRPNIQGKNYKKSYMCSI